MRCDTGGAGDAGTLGSMAPAGAGRARGAGGRGGPGGPSRSVAARAAPGTAAARYVAVNRFRTKRGGAPAALEKRWADRPSRLAEMAGFRFFSLLRRVPASAGGVLELPAGDDFDYFSFTVWQDEASFQVWRQGSAFKEAHGGGNFAGVVGMIVSSAKTLKGPPKLATFNARVPVSVPLAADELPEVVDGWRKVKADGINLLEPECFVAMERFSVPEGREAAFAAAAAASGPDATFIPEGFRFASALQREQSKPEDGSNFYSTSVWADREAYKAGKGALGTAALAEEFGAPCAAPLLFEGMLVIGTPEGI